MCMITDFKFLDESNKAVYSVKFVPQIVLGGFV